MRHESEPRAWLRGRLVNPCAACHEFTARAYLRVLGDKHVCIPRSGYER